MEFIPYKPKTETLFGDEYIVLQQNHHILKQRREELHLTQQEVADAARILLRQYQRFENGERDFCNSSPRIMLSVCAILKFDPYTFFPELEEYQKRMKEKNSVVYIPAKPSTVVPVSKYIALICNVPEGRVTRWEDIEAFFKKIYNAEYIRPADSYWERESVGGKAVPYWRIVGPRGHIGNDSRIGDKYTQIQRLQNEGVVAEICNEKTQSYRVKNYKDLLFDYDLVNAEEIRSLPNTDRNSAAVRGEMLLSEEHIRGMPMHILRRIASGKMGFDDVYVERANLEIKRRNKSN